MDSGEKGDDGAAEGRKAGAKAADPAAERERRSRERAMVLLGSITGLSWLAGWLGVQLVPVRALARGDQEAGWRTADLGYPAGGGERERME
jgi:hypothetical protein